MSTNFANWILYTMANFQLLWLGMISTVLTKLSKLSHFMQFLDIATFDSLLRVKVLCISVKPLSTTASFLHIITRVTTLSTLVILACTHLDFINTGFGHKNYHVFLINIAHVLVTYSSVKLKILIREENMCALS